MTIPPEKQNRDLRNELRAELSGILNWAIIGCLDWQKSGLQPPSEVQRATEAYRDETDIIGQFIQDALEFDSQLSLDGVVAEEPVFTASADLYRYFRVWAGLSGHPALSQRRLVNRIAVLPGVKSGFAHGKRRGYRGVRISTEFSSHVRKLLASRAEMQF